MVPPVVLERIPFACDLDSLKRRLRLKLGAPRERSLAAMADQARAVGRPKALYRVVTADYGLDDRVVLDGKTGRSALLRRSLLGARTVLPFAATCGRELEAWAAGVSGLLRRYWAEVIMGMALDAALTALEQHVSQRLGPGQLRRLGPGSPPGWPVAERKTLRALLGGTKALVGVDLDPDCLPIPLKSMVGFLFQAEAAAGKCLFCSQKSCPDRVPAPMPDHGW